MAISSALHAVISLITFTVIWIESNIHTHVLINLLNLSLKLCFPKLGKKFNNIHLCNKIVYLANPFVGLVHFLFIHLFIHLVVPTVYKGTKYLSTLMNLNHI